MVIWFFVHKLLEIAFSYKLFSIIFWIYNFPLCYVSYPCGTSNTFLDFSFLHLPSLVADTVHYHFLWLWLAPLYLLHSKQFSLILDTPTCYVMGPRNCFWILVCHKKGDVCRILEIPFLSIKTWMTLPIYARFLYPNVILYSLLNIKKTSI